MIWLTSDYSDLKMISLSKKEIIPVTWVRKFTEFDRVSSWIFGAL